MSKDFPKKILDKTLFDCFLDEHFLMNLLSARFRTNQVPLVSFVMANSDNCFSEEGIVSFVNKKYRESLTDVHNKAIDFTDRFLKDYITAYTNEKLKSITFNRVYTPQKSLSKLKQEINDFQLPIKLKLELSLVRSESLLMPEFDNVQKNDKLFHYRPIESLIYLHFKDDDYKILSFSYELSENLPVEVDDPNCPILDTYDGESPTGATIKIELGGNSSNTDKISIHSKQSLAGKKRHNGTDANIIKTKVFPRLYEYFIELNPESSSRDIAEKIKEELKTLKKTIGKSDTFDFSSDHKAIQNYIKDPIPDTIYKWCLNENKKDVAS